MAANEGNWVGDIINDFIHSSIWLSPIQTFIDMNCACFDYDEDHSYSLALVNEQKLIHKQYQTLANSLLTSLSEDLKLDMNEMKDFYQRNNAAAMDEFYEQLYSINDFFLFTEMMTRKNLILQLQALVNLQLKCGLLKQTDYNDDRVLQLLLKATSSSLSSSNKIAAEYSSTSVSNSKQSETIAMNTRSHKETQSIKTKTNMEARTVDSIPEEILREKLKELTISTKASTDYETASVMSSREHFLKQQRDIIISQQRNKRVLELEKESNHVRPQSTANVARNATEINHKQEELVSNNEIEKRRAMIAKLRREVIDKR